VIRLDFHAWQHPPEVGAVNLLHRGFDILERRKGIVALAKQNNALDLVVIVMSDFGKRTPIAGGSLFVGFPIAKAPESRLMADDHPPVARHLPRREPASHDDVLHSD